MAEVTKRKLTAVYSMIAGFFLSLFSGHVHAGELFYKSKQTETTTKKAQPVGANNYNSNTVPSAGHMRPAAPDANTDILNTMPSAGHMRVAAPDADKASNSELMNVENVEDPSMRSFMSQKAMEQGMNPDQLSIEKFNTLRMDYLQIQVKALEEKLQQ